MVTCQLEGGLCNNLFQMAFLIAYAKKHNLEYCIPTQVNTPHIPGKGAYFFIGVKYCNNSIQLPFFDELHFHYAEIPFMDNVCFRGYWQSFKYFEDYREDILKAFAFKWEMKKNYVSIHVRLDDYLKWSEYHPPVTEYYLRSAIIEMYKKVGNVNTKFKFFSDDIGWCKQFAQKEFSLSDNMVEFSEGKNELDDLEEASCCEFNIGSNSAYSLWIYFLNQNHDKVGVFPAAWFGAALNHNTKDLYPPEAIVL